MFEPSFSTKSYINNNWTNEMLSQVYWRITEASGRPCHHWVQSTHHNCQATLLHLPLPSLHLHLNTSHPLLHPAPATTPPLPATPPITWQQLLAPTHSALLYLPSLVLDLTISSTLNLKALLCKYFEIYSKQTNFIRKMYFYVRLLYSSTHIVIFGETSNVNFYFYWWKFYKI